MGTNTKNLLVFFVILFFRVFVMKDLYFRDTRVGRYVNEGYG